MWIDGLEISQFTYFQQIGGIDCRPVSGELTYGLERIAMYLQDVESVYDVMWSKDVRYGELCKRAEWEWSTYNFEQADVKAHFAAFDHAESECKRLLSFGGSDPKDVESAKKKLVLPAYDFVVKAAHAFNVLDARGAIGVTERARFIGRVRGLAKAVAEAYLAQREALGFPLLRRGEQREEPRGRGAAVIAHARISGVTEIAGLLFAFATCALLSAGCGGGGGDARYPKRPEGCDVALYHEIPDVPTDNIGPVHAACSEDVTADDCVRTLKDVVCKLGARRRLGRGRAEEKEDGKVHYEGRAAHTKGPHARASGVRPTGIDVMGVF